jgi:predicted TIM-barrel fold metal-dependent hydrolase
MVETFPLPDFETRQPTLPVPAGACDTHAHIFGAMDRYPPAAMRRYNPPDIPVSRYQAMLRALGVERGVLVQSSAYGTDNRLLLDGLAEAGDNFRGIALLRADVPADELRLFDRGGIRGVRVSTLPHGHVEPEEIPGLAKRIADLGWIIQVHLDHIGHMRTLLPFARDLATPCLIDHLGRVRGGQGIDHADFRALLDLFEKDTNCWVKLCSFYRLSDIGHPTYADMEPFVRALVETAPDRLVWGTNWPHPNHRGPMPNDGDLYDVLFGWIGEEGVRRKILVDNPARLFGFK